MTYKVKYNKNGYISILQTGYDYQMGAHGTTYYVSHTFDLNTGKELGLTDILSGSQKEIKQCIIAAFSTEQKKNKEMYFENALSIVKTSANPKNKNFYLTNSNIVFYYGVYELAPYAAGIPTTKISYKKGSYFKIKL